MKAEWIELSEECQSTPWIVNRYLSKNHSLKRHSQRVSSLCQSMGRVLELSEEEAAQLEKAALLHDIGKAFIDSSIIDKPGQLNEEEWVEVKGHPGKGFDILCAFGDMEVTAPLILAHHERWDGRGYPRGLKGEEIPFLTRIISIADTYDAMTSSRSYRKPLSKRKAIEELRRNAGTQFDPDLVHIFINKVVVGERERVR
ncbi:HD-GYP domain-containing protein [Desulfitobacterium dehalogenans ATCC 51507]|uniref:HD-GYP domain-containing protein n=1 Tax=Desulfitobacterium dehalogenans (strain ATCC 51507 / DSM 9161 / JW/IU-DC1) TaxID=756499 RepID=I4ACT2_DESDJ|nr:HD-GYP domain-containing protein [Desulfitobacterium dehalogenans]AFM01767.1 HD-GYP domain-containing protein [Desulfitobacterium dehalogenans ATCC 51507]